MEKDDIKIVFADNIPPSPFHFDPTGALLKSIGGEHKGPKRSMVVLLLVAGLLSVFLIGNLALYAYALRSLPAGMKKKKKAVSAKKIKKERLKYGVSPPGESN